MIWLWASISRQFVSWSFLHRTAFCAPSKERWLKKMAKLEFCWPVCCLWRALIQEAPLDFPWFEYEDRIVRTVFVKDLCLKLLNLFNLFVRWDLVFNRVCGYRHHQHIVVHGARMFQPFVMMFGGAIPWFVPETEQPVCMIDLVCACREAVWSFVSASQVTYPPVPMQSDRSTDFNCQDIAWSRGAVVWARLVASFVDYRFSTGSTWVCLKVDAHKMCDATATMMVNLRTIFLGVL